MSSSRITYITENKWEPSVTFNRYNWDLSASRTSYGSVNEKFNKFIESKTKFREPIFKQTITEKRREPRISVSRYERIPSRTSIHNSYISMADKIPVFTINEDPSPKQTNSKTNLNETKKSYLSKYSFESDKEEINE